jgi:hypothetical protein
MYSSFSVGLYPGGSFTVMRRLLGEMRKEAFYKELPAKMQRLIRAGSNAVLSIINQ